jgi:hypothetical protein
VRVYVPDAVITPEFVVYCLRIVDQKGDTWNVLKRYSSLRAQHRRLRRALKPETLPDFPPKRWFGADDERFVAKRRAALDDYFRALNEAGGRAASDPTLLAYLRRNDPLTDRHASVMFRGIDASDHDELEGCGRG